METITRTCCLEELVACLDEPHSTLKSRSARVTAEKLAIRTFGSMNAAKDAVRGYVEKADSDTLTKQLLAWETDPDPPLLLARIVRYALDNRRKRARRAAQRTLAARK